ncbi:MAG: SRPBCC domain-containing protein [Flavobacteriia bacterium]|nr:SRPBCC domain-containing protein [Flavobacteriia bacterium]OJX39073.1 MAG: ATPase [Flavobacteriia bacterium 40-80]
MNSNLLFDFTVNKENNTIHIQREFNANLELVWKAWTTAELLDQWWGPKPWRAETKTMDFREGGSWLYAMVGPEGEKHWSKADYIKIIKEKSFTQKDGFCDENGTMDPEYPQNLLENSFSQKDDKVLVDMLLTFDTLADLETTLTMGFKEGMTIDFNQLDELLLALKK